MRAAACAPRLVRRFAIAPALLLFTVTAHAQTYARFAVDDSTLVGTLRASRSEFENTWNALLVSEIRASLARADSAARLAALARRVAVAEPQALGTRIASDALTRRGRWKPEQLRLRVSAAVDESLGAVVRRGRDFGHADSLYRAALGAYRRLDEPRRVAFTLAILGGIAIDRRDWSAADSITRQALAAARPLGDPRLEGITLNMLGSAAYQQKRLDDAWKYYQGARAAREQIGDRAALGTTLGYLGNVASGQGRRDTAEVCYRAALDLTVAIGDSARTLEVLNNYAAFLMNGPDPATALPLFERSLAIRRQRGDRAAQAEVMLNIGDLLRQQGHYAEALEWLEQSTSLALAASDLRTLRMSLVNLGRAAIGVGDPERARPALEHALAIADSLGDAEVQVKALSDLSIASRQTGDPSGAERLAERALAIASQAGDSSLVHLAATTMGEIAFERSDFAAARWWFERAASAGGTQSGSQASDDLNLGSVAARSGRLDDAERLFQRASAGARGDASNDVTWLAMLGLGDVAEQRGDHARALAFDRQAAGMIEQLRARQGSERPSVRLLARRLFAFEALIHLLTHLQPSFPDSAFTAEAFQWSERARARAFLDLVAATGSEPEEAVRPLSITEAQERIRSDHDALLAYSVGDSSTSLWVVKRNGWKHFVLPARGALRAPVEILRRGLSDPAAADAPGTRRAERDLYRTLIEPARTMLKGIDRLIVAPDGALALIPFEALLATDDDARGRPPAGAYLVERYAVSYTPSATALATRLSAGHGDGVVALGDPAFSGPRGGGPKLAPLPGSAAEVDSLEKFVGRRPIVVLTGRNATRERLLGLAELPRAELVHIATHGRADEVEPERSGLWMASPADTLEPGFLSLADILALKLSAGVVTLSACETGLGRLERGEGVVGLGRAFLAAGARSVIVSLWKVNDRSTAMLMARFYRSLLEDSAPGAVALARAKRAMLANPAARSPFYWAPFVLIGSGGPLQN